MKKILMVLCLSAFALTACNEPAQQQSADGTPVQAQDHTLRDGLIGGAIGYFLGSRNNGSGASSGGMAGQGGGTVINRTVNQTVIQKNTIINKHPPKPEVKAASKVDTPHQAPKAATMSSPRASMPARSAPIYSRSGGRR